MLSPYITLYFKGERKHSSKFSGVLSIIAYIIVFFIGIYYIYDYIYNKVPQAFFFNRYIEDAGNYPLNSSSMFHYLKLSERRGGKVIPFDFSLMRVIGIEKLMYDSYVNNPNAIFERNHWLYGYCNNNTDIEGLETLIDYNNIEKSICIKKFYDIKTKKYYNIGEKEFRWPVLEKGASNPNRTFYGIILQRCDKVPDLIKSQDLDIECGNEAEINAKFNKYLLNIAVVDNIADILNFEKPLSKNIYEITTAISQGVFSINNLNFNPVNMLTHNGALIDNIISENAYIFTQNEKATIDSSTLGKNQNTNGCLIAVYFWMQNNLQYYERINTKLQDVLSDVGGIYSIIETIAYIINLLVHNFIIVLDTEDLVINRDKDNFNENNRNKRPAILRRANRIKNPPKRQNILGKMIYHNDDKEEQSSSSHFRKIKDKSDIFQNSNDSNSNKNNINNNLLNSLEKDNSVNNINNNIIRNINRIRKSKSFGKAINKEIQNRKNSLDIDTDAKTDNKDNSISLNSDNKEKKSIDENNIRNINKDNKTIQEKIEEIDNRPIEKQNFTWFKYLRYLIYCRKRNQGISYYENFRANLISEENIIQSYLDVYKLLDTQKNKNEKMKND